MSDLRCPAHPDVHLIEDHRAGDVICPQCGLVVGDRIIDVSSEWRSFNNEKSVSDPSRVGAPENSLLSGSDLSTSIAAAPGSDYASLSNQQRKQMNTNDRQLIQGFQIIRDMADRINLPKSIVDTAHRTFKNVTETKALKGRNSEAVSAACLYIACRREDVPRSFKEIVAVSKCSKKELGRVFRLCMKALEANLKIITSQDFMSRFCGNLQLPRKIEAAAIHIAKRAVDLNLVAGRSPISVAAAAIYMASQAAAENFRRKASEISEIAGVAEVTIKQSYKLMLPRAAELFPDDFTFVTSIDQLPNS